MLLQSSNGPIDSAVGKRGETKNTRKVKKLCLQLQVSEQFTKTSRQKKIRHVARRRYRIDDNLSKSIRPGVEYNDVNSINRSKDGTNSVTGDDFGKVNLFKFPCTVLKAQSNEYFGNSSHVFKLTNNGHVDAKFRWQKTLKIFVPEPLSAMIEPGKHFKLKVTFFPPGPKIDEETLVLKIKDGSDEELRC